MAKLKLTRLKMKQTPYDRWFTDYEDGAFDIMADVASTLLDLDW